jgi:hypothetical protein
MTYRHVDLEQPAVNATHLDTQGSLSTELRGVLGRGCRGGVGRLGHGKSRLVRFCFLLALWTERFSKHGLIPILPRRAWQPARVTAHTVPTDQFPRRTVVLIKLDRTVLDREEGLGK